MLGCAMPPLRIGIVYDLLGSLPLRPGDPRDADAEYEPEETVRALEAAIARLGHRPVRIGSPHDRCREMHQSGRDSSMPRSRLRPHAG